MARLHLQIGGMHCSFCSQTIEQALSKMSGVQRAAVSLAHEEALIDYDADQVGEPELREALTALGYPIRDPERFRAYQQEQDELDDKRRRTIVGAVASGLIALVMGAMWAGVGPVPLWGRVLTGLLAAGVVFGTGRPILSMAVAGLWRRIFNQHVLLMFGAVGAFLAGLLGFLLERFPTFHFFSASIFLMTYHLLSGYAATAVRARSQQAVRKLLELRPNTASRLEGGTEVEVPVEQVGVGERVRIRPGESVPLDGKVAEGHSTVDESIVTGEPIPAEKSPGDEVIGGSLNQAGALVAEVTASSEEGFLQQVARHVEHGRALKPGIVQLVDWVLKFYVSGVVAIGTGALLFWILGGWLLAGTVPWVRAVYAMLTVFVMGYPCALGMATPLALLRGGWMAAERGVLMRSGEAFEVFKDVDTVVFDKTGTVTEGAPRVTEIRPVGDADGSDVLRWAASAEQASEHPLGRAILDRAENDGLDAASVDDFEALPGRGVTATVDGRSVVVGTRRLLEERDIRSAEATEALDAIEAQGQTAVLVAVDETVVGVIAIGDRVKEGASRAVRSLREMGVAPLMITGDNERTAGAIADAVGIERVFAGILPDRKAEEIGQLQEAGHRVAMVGDGINDAPALSRADVGVAIGAGTDIAIESADVVLVHGRLAGVVAAFEVSRNSYRKTKQNLLAAFLFNGIGVPVAATGLLHPVWAMGAMVASVSLVLANSFGGRLVRHAAGGQMPEAAGEKQLELRVPGMHCTSCEKAVAVGLERYAGVERVEANARVGRVQVEATGDLDEDALAERLAAMGYEVK